MEVLLQKIPVDMIAWILAVFALMSAVSSFLSFVAKKTETKTDDKLAYYFGKLCGFLGWLVDKLSNNTRVKK